MAIFLILSFIAVGHAQLLEPTDPDAFLKTDELLVKYGYPVEVHEVVTEDGYVLTLHRIPHGRNMTNTSSYPLVLQHGILCSSADWVYTNNNSLALLLADKGYDVWLTNSRGNVYSEKHVNMSSSDPKFWEFSWHEMGTKDLPAVIDYILNNTGVQQIFYVGTSMGTTMFYVMCSELPGYNDKIRAMISLAPVAYTGNMHSPILKALSLVGDQVMTAANVVGINSLPYTKAVNLANSVSCGLLSTTKQLCGSLLFLIAGFDSQLLNETLVPTIMGHYPAGTSLKALVHYSQGIRSLKFRQYDYGAEENLKRYGNETSPDYDLGRITAPVYLDYAKNDWIASVEDVQQLDSELGNSAGMYLVPFPKFNHLDFLWAINVTWLEYNTVLNHLQNHV